MPTALLPEGRQRYFNNDGTPCAGGKLWTYAAGTTALRVAYADEAGTTPHPNPITLDAHGEAVIYWSGAYKVDLKQADGTQVTGYPVDNLKTDPAGVWAVVTSAGAALVGVIAAAAGAVVRSVRDVLGDTIRVNDFGADPTGVLDSSAGIQAAIAAAGDFRTVEFSGTYRVDTALNPRKGQKFMGKGSTLNVKPGTHGFTSADMLWPGQLHFKGLRLISSGNTAHGIYFYNNTPMVRVDDCYIEGFDVGVSLKDAYCSTISRNYFFRNKYGVIGVSLIESAIRDNLFDESIECAVALNGTSGGPAAGRSEQYLTPNITVANNAMQNSKYGLWAEFCQDLKIHENYFESNTVHDLHIGDFQSFGINRYCYGVVVDGAYLNSGMGATGKPSIYISNTTRSKFLNLNFQDQPPATAPTAALIKVDSGCAGVQIEVTEHPELAISTTWPVDATASASGVILSLQGKTYIPRDNVDTMYGVPGDSGMRIYRRVTPNVGRPAFCVEALGSSHDVMVKVNDVLRVYNTADVSKFEVNHVGSIVATGYPILPITDNSVALGTTFQRFTQLFAATATISTSDERVKQQIAPIDAAALRAWGKVEYCQFKFADSVAVKDDGARWHVGVIAQRVKAAFESEGLDPFAYGVLCHDAWDDAFEDVLDADGQPTGERIQTRTAGDRYGVRYEEALVLECAYLRSRLMTN